jgi:membrane-associated protease RseP (regulator of RpoE activity)
MNINFQAYQLAFVWIGAVCLSLVTQAPMFAQETTDESKQKIKLKLLDNDQDHKEAVEYYLTLQSDKAELQEDEKQKDEKKFWLGVQCLPDKPFEFDSKDLGRVTLSGLEISSVIQNAPAQMAGLKSGDIIYKCDDERLGDLSELSTIIEGKGEKELSLLIVRNGEMETFNVTPARRPEKEKPATLSVDNGNDQARWYYLAQSQYESGEAKLPKGVTVNIELKSGESPNIKISKDDEEFSVVKGKLNELPEDLQGVGSSLLRSLEKVTQPNAKLKTLADRAQQFWYRNNNPGPIWRVVGQNQFSRKVLLDVMDSKSESPNSRFKKLENQIKELKEMVLKLSEEK